MSGTGTQPHYCTDQEAMEELNLFSLPCRVQGHKRKNGYISNVNWRWHCVATNTTATVQISAFRTLCFPPNGSHDGVGHYQARIIICCIYG